MSKLMYSSKNVSGIYFVKYFKIKTAFSVIFKTKSAGNRKLAIFAPFCIFRAAWKAYLTYLTSYTTTPLPSTPPANSQRSKQFLSRPNSLLLFSKGMHGASDYGCSMT
jgi:hypothetical protein